MPSPKSAVKTRGREPVGRKKILKWVTDHPEVEFTVAEVTAATKTTPSWTRSTLVKAGHDDLPGLIRVSSRKFKYLPDVGAQPDAQFDAVQPSVNGIGKKRGPKPKVPMPKSISFKVVAELRDGGILLDFGGNYFVARPVDL